MAFAPHPDRIPDAATKRGGDRGKNLRLCPLNLYLYPFFVYLYPMYIVAAAAALYSVNELGVPGGVQLYQREGIEQP